MMAKLALRILAKLATSAASVRAFRNGWMHYCYRKTINKNL